MSLAPYQFGGLHFWTEREIASCFIRTDFSKETRVCEIAIGLDRVIEIANM